MKYQISEIKSDLEYINMLRRYKRVINDPLLREEAAYIQAMRNEIDRYNNFMLKRNHDNRERKFRKLVYVVEDFALIVSLLHTLVALYCLVSLRTIIGTIFSCVYLGISVYAVSVVSKLIVSRKGE